MTTVFRNASSENIYFINIDRKLHNGILYIKGWALYAEYLGEEMNLYEDDYEQ